MGIIKNLLNKLGKKTTRTRTVNYNTGNITYTKEQVSYEDFNNDLIKVKRVTKNVHSKDGHLLETIQTKIYYLDSFK